jgi:hypothetical protein
MAATEQSSDVAGDRGLDCSRAPAVRVVDHRSGQGSYLHRRCGTDDANMDAAAGDFVDLDR